MLRVDVRNRLSAADAFIEARPAGVCRRWSQGLEGGGADDASRHVCGCDESAVGAEATSSAGFDGTGDPQGEVAAEVCAVEFCGACDGGFLVWVWSVAGSVGRLLLRAPGVRKSELRMLEGCVSRARLRRCRPVRGGGRRGGMELTRVILALMCTGEAWPLCVACSMESLRLPI